MGGARSTYGESIGAYMALWENLREGDHLEDPDVDGRVILRWIIEKWVGEQGLD